MPVLIVLLAALGGSVRPVLQPHAALAAAPAAAVAGLHQPQPFQPGQRWRGSICQTGQQLRQAAGCGWLGRGAGLGCYMQGGWTFGGCVACCMRCCMGFVQKQMMLKVCAGTDGGSGWHGHVL